MLGLLGKSLIGTDHLTGPTGDEEERAARFARHELVRGKPALQDLGNDAATKRLSFFFDETFCDPEAELRKLDLAFKARVPMQLFLDLTGFQVGVFLIERLRITTQKTTASGKAVRIELEAELIESALSLGGVIGRAIRTARTLTNPLLRRR